MFKLAAFIRNDGVSINPFACTHLSSFLRGGVVVMTQSMFEACDGFKDMIKLGAIVAALIVIGNKTSAMESGISDTQAVVFVDDIRACIKHLSSTYVARPWWFIGDNQMANDMIWNGLIMDVHLSKSYAAANTSEWKSINQLKLDDAVLLNKDLLEQPNMEFQLLSKSRSDASLTKTIRHYMRRNIEESHLLLAMNRIITCGFNRPNRTGVDTRALFGQQFEYRMVERIDPETGKSSFRLPLLTTKRMFTRGVFAELNWFLRGGTDSKVLEAQGVNIWKGNTSRAFLDSVGLNQYAEGETGPSYPFQFRHASAEYIPGKFDYRGEGIDQVQQVIDSLQKDPFSRRHIINLWAPAQIQEICLPPCHILYQFMAHEEEGQMYLTLSMLQRSCDTFHGLPFNICSMGIFLTLMAHRVNMKPFKLIHFINDMHIYETHFGVASKQIQREPCMFPYISMNCEPKDNLEDYAFSDIAIADYYYHPAIKADMVA